MQYTLNERTISTMKMRRIKKSVMSIIFLILLAPISISLSSCAKNQTKQLDIYEDPDLMEEEIGRLIPLGSSVEQARKVMELSGFECEYFENGSFARVRNAHDSPGGMDATYYDGVDGLYCQFHRGVFVETRWQSLIAHEEGKVTVIAVSVGLIGL
ncbi:MAG: hypothetical protein F6J87_07835 [Spirulina sp. SIO3F2]|nr:hypothetical protein [Spirulina sp. SIO3F2]